MEFPNVKYEGLHIPNLLSVEDEKKFNEFIDCDIFNILDISKRIGSESQVGTIWLSSLSRGNFQISFVIKVQSNRNKAHLEFETQHFLSHKWPNNFVISYNSIDCPEVILRNGREVTIIKTGNFIFMETAIGDLSQVIRYSIINEKTLISYILDVIESVKIMSFEQFFHGDLHIRQIFIVLRSITNCEQYYKAVIGDFGEHLKIDSPTMHLTDLKIFFRSLLEFVGNSQNLVLKINKCLDYIEKETVRIEMNDDIYYDQRNIEKDISKIREFLG